MTLRFFSKLFRREPRPVAGSVEHAKESSDAAPGFHDDASGIADMDDRAERQRKQDLQAIDFMLNVVLVATAAVLLVAIYGCAVAHFSSQ